VAAAETIELGDGRTLGFDDAGDPAGAPVLYVHGSPDSRRSRHPDDRIAGRLGVRLVSVDRPGSGLSTPHPEGTFGSFADDAVALADHLGVERWRPLGWSAGGPFALAVGARHPDRVERVAVAAGLVPFAAYATPGILDDADPGRHAVADLGEQLGPQGMAGVLADMVAPFPCDLELAREHVLDGAGPDRLAVFDAIPGSADALAWGVVDAVASGLGGITRDLELQVEVPDVDWSAVACPVDLWFGTDDHTAPPAFGRWWQAELPQAQLRVLPDAGHLLALTHWTEILTALSG
jgi:pimeloyl-ACP methyl ester carboxylesterase